MLTKKQITQIKESLEKSQNPLFFFDNDADGLCSFLLLQKYAGRGKGVPVKTFPGLTADYFRKINELNPDCVFILDKPIVEEEFWKKIEQINLPVIWIDHHEINKDSIPEFVDYYNPLYNPKSNNEPVTYLCHQINNKKEDLWISVAGCISDKFFPDFYEDFKKDFPELTIDSKNAFEILYESEIGEIARILGFALKDRTSHVINMLKFLIKAKTPYDVLDETPKNYLMHKKSREIERKYNLLLEKALLKKSAKVLFFEYGGDLSISAELSNELSYHFPEKIIVVSYVRGSKVNISVRGKDIKNKFLEVLSKIEDSTGGGHPDAVGGTIPFNDLDFFKKQFEKII